MSSTVRFMIALTASWTLFNAAVIVVVFVFVPLDSGEEAPPSAVALPPAPPAANVITPVAVASADGEAHEEGDADDEREGHDLFVAKGCSACHGQDAEGTTIAPALAGHTEQMVRRQVRTPRFKMPAFSVTQVSDDELEAIVQYIATLEGGGHLHAELPASELAVALEMHHWMALESLKADSADDAIHHVGHIVELLQEGDHQRTMEAILVSLQAGETHGPEHDIEQMVAGTVVPGLTLSELHLRQALVALAVEDLSDAQHHVAHFQGTADAGGVERATEILALFEGGSVQDVEHEINELLGEEEHED